MPALRSAPWLLGIALVLVVAPVHADLPPISPDLARALQAVVPDPPPKKLAANAHFVVSDEGAHWLFRDTVADLGGALLGVGTDPNYLLAGWAKSDLVVLLDFDQVVVNVHAVYREVFLRSPDPHSFLAAWSASKREEVEGWIGETYSEDQSRREQVLKTFRMARNLIEWRLRSLRKTYRERKVATFLDDSNQYGHLRDLFRAGRVFAIRGDLVGRSAFQGVAKALSDARVPVRVLYLSNAEKYFEFTRDYKANMRALPFDDRSVVLRTAGGWDPEIAPDGLYTYLVQPAASFLAWMKDDVSCSFKTLVSRRKHDKSRPGFATITALPPRPSESKKR